MTGISQPLICWPLTPNVFIYLFYSYYPIAGYKRLQAHTTHFYVSVPIIVSYFKSWCNVLYFWSLVIKHLHSFLFILKFYSVRIYLFLFGLLRWGSIIIIDESIWSNVLVLVKWKQHWKITLRYLKESAYVLMKKVTLTTVCQALWESLTTLKNNYGSLVPHWKIKKHFRSITFLLLEDR